MGWLIPTHARPEKLARLIGSMKAEDLEVPATVLLWDQDPRLVEYDSVELPPTWEKVVGPAEWCGSKLNWYFQQNPNEKFYGFLADDVQIMTPGFMQQLSEVAGDWFVAYPDDGVHGPKLATHFCCGGEFIRALGYWTHPTLKHNYIDFMLMDVAGHQDVKLLRYVPECRLLVRHPAIQHPEEFDETYRKAMLVNELADIYYVKLRDSRELERMVGRVKTAYAAARRLAA